VLHDRRARRLDYLSGAGRDSLDLGGFASLRTNPVTILVVGLGAGGLLFWLSRHIPARRPGTHRLITVTERYLD
jgi:hypothetical protein